MFLIVLKFNCTTVDYYDSSIILLFYYSIFESIILFHQT